ncbi:MAG TPA: molybdopterin-guanine dinucleotide biosynthesis protein B [Thermoanaerobaculia bacterium]|nr:molybdopterin-guanine dinucleotide biosynthesis protein B [Thermoanaerobaculia bacterium]
MALSRVLGVAGWKGSGKTTLLERLIPELVAAGLAVVVVEHDAHGLRLDAAGTDSDRLFGAGADVLVAAPGESLGRWHRADEGQPIEGHPAAREHGLVAELAALERRYDLVLVEGFKGERFPKVWLGRPGEEAPPEAACEVLAALPWDGDRVGFLATLVRARLAAAWAAADRRAGLLVGGHSRRMGMAKQEMVVGGRTLLQRALAALAEAGPATLLGGEGATAVLRLPDAPGVSGPLGGVLAALRWAPVTWTIAACDLPRVNAAAVAWLLAQRRPGSWAVLPVVDGAPQPLLAVYEPQVLPLLEGIARETAPGPSRLAGHPRVAMPAPPPELAAAWRGVNTPEELAALGDDSS